MPHEVPVMAIMAVVVAENPPVVYPADEMIDVREIVLRHFAIRRLPHFFPQFSSAPGPLQDYRIVDNLYRKPPSPGLFRHSPKFIADGSWNDSSVEIKEPDGEIRSEDFRETGMRHGDR
jgi:hypothetical protein